MRSARAARYALAAFCLAAAAPPSAVHADAVIMKRGNKRLEGKILQESDDSVTIRVRGSDMAIPRSLIASVEREEGVGLEESEGDAAFSGQDFDRALERYRAALEGARDEESRARVRAKLKRAERNVRERDEEVVSRHFREFETFIQRRDFERAEGVLFRVERAYQGNPVFERAVSRNRARLYMAKAAKALDSVNTAWAKREIEQALILDDTYYPAHDLAGRIYMDAGEPEQALVHFRRALEEGEEEMGAEKAQALKVQVSGLLHAEGRYAEALPFLAGLRASGGTGSDRAADLEIDCLRRLGEQAFEDANPQRAAELFGQAVEVAPNHPAIRHIRLRLGEIYLEDERPQQALAEFSTLAGDPAFPDVYQKIAEGHAMLGEDALAIDALRRQLETNPSNYTAFIELAKLYIAASEYQKAEKTLEGAIALNSDPSDAYLMLGRLRRLQERYSDAKALFVQVLAKDPNIREAELLLGEVYLAEKDFQNSADRFERVIAFYESQPGLSPESRETLIAAYNGRALVDLERQQARLALDRLRKAQNLDPEHAVTHKNMGDAHKKVAAYERAEQHYKAAMDLEPENPEHVLALALLYHNNMDRRAEAVTLYNLYFDRGGQDYANVNKWLAELGAPARAPKARR